MAGFISNLLGVGNNGTAVNPPPNAAAGPIPTAPAPAPVPGAPAPAPSPTPAPAPGSALDQFKDLWQNPTNAEGKPVVYTDPLAQPVLQFDPAKIQESAAKLNFTSGLAPELLTKALSGDVQAFADILNSVARAAVTGVTVNTGQVVNAALATQSQRLQEALPSHVKRVQLAQQPVDNPILEHPSVQPLMNALKQAEFNKNPSADPAEVHKKVSDYLVTFASTLVNNDPKTVQQAQQKAAGEMDWDAWADQGTSRQ